MAAFTPRASSCLHRARSHAVERSGGNRDLVARAREFRASNCRKHLVGESPTAGWRAGSDGVGMGLKATKKANTRREIMKTLKVSLARLMGKVIGTDTIWAPTTSFSFQPKPFAGP